MTRKNWIIGSVRVTCYILIILGLGVVGHSMDNTPITRWTFDPSQCMTGGFSSGGGTAGLPAPQNNVTWEWQFPPQPWVLDYVKNDLDVQELNCTSFYLRVKVGSEEGFVNPTNVSAQLENATGAIPIILHYNVSRGEYVTIFKLASLIPNPLQIKIMINCTNPSTTRTFTIISSPNVFYPYRGIFAANLTIGGIAVVLIEVLIRLLSKYRLTQKERLKDQALLRLLRRQNQDAYENALKQLQADHDQLIHQIESAEHQEGGRADA